MVENFAEGRNFLGCRPAAVSRCNSSFRPCYILLYRHFNYQRL